MRHEHRTLWILPVFLSLAFVLAGCAPAAISPTQPPASSPVTTDGTTAPEATLAETATPAPEETLASEATPAAETTPAPEETTEAAETAPSEATPTPEEPEATPAAETDPTPAPAETAVPVPSMEPENAAANFNRDQAQKLLDIAAETVASSGVQGFAGDVSPSFYYCFIYQVLNEMYYDDSEIDVTEAGGGKSFIAQDAMDSLFTWFFAEGNPPALAEQSYFTPSTEGDGYDFHYSDRGDVTHRFDIVTVEMAEGSANTYLLTADLVKVYYGEEGEAAADVIGRYAIALVESKTASMGYLLDRVEAIN